MQGEAYVHVVECAHESALRSDPTIDVGILFTGLVPSAVSLNAACSIC